MPVQQAAQIITDVAGPVTLCEQQPYLPFAVEDEHRAGMVDGVVAIGIALAVTERHPVTPGQGAQLPLRAGKADDLVCEGTGIFGQPGWCVPVGIDADKQDPGAVGLLADVVQDRRQFAQCGRTDHLAVAKAEKQHHYLAGVIIGVHGMAVLVRQGEGQVGHEMGDGPGLPRRALLAPCQDCR